MSKECRKFKNCSVPFELRTTLSKSPPQHVWQTYEPSKLGIRKPILGGGGGGVFVFVCFFLFVCLFVCLFFRF